MEYDFAAGFILGYMAGAAVYHFGISLVARWFNAIWACKRKHVE